MRHREGVPPLPPEGPSLTGLWLFLITLALVGAGIVAEDVVGRVPVGAAWERAHGQVVTAEVQRIVHADKHGEHVTYRPHVVVAYVWGGVAHTTDRASPGAAFPAFDDPADADRAAASWRGREPDVWVDRNQQDYAVLDTSLLPALGLIGTGALGMLALVGMAGLYAVLILRLPAGSTPGTRPWRSLLPR